MQETYHEGNLCTKLNGNDTSSAINHLLCELVDIDPPRVKDWLFLFHNRLDTSKNLTVWMKFAPIMQHQRKTHFFLKFCMCLSEFIVSH